MEENLLLSSHLSSLYSPSQSLLVTVQTTKQNIPLPLLPTDSDPPSEHATFASLFHSVQTGPILIRLIHNGLIIELISLATETTPIRFLFPAAVLPKPAVFIWQAHQLHILAVTATGSLYRIVVPLRTPTQLWTDQLGINWCREYHLRSVPDTLHAVVQVQGTHAVAIALTNGSLIRLDTDVIGDESSDDQWTENVFQHTSFLTTLTSFLHQGPIEGSQIVATASHPQPTDVGHVWTLSRDRTLRLWTARSGCTSARTLPSSATTVRELSPAAGSSAPPKPSVLLEPESQNLLSVFSVDDNLYVLVFIPTPSSPSSGGFFQIFSANRDTLHLVETFETSSASAHCHLQEFVVIGGTLYTLWDRQGQSAVERLEAPLMEVANGSAAASWRAALYPHEPDLTPSYLDELLLSPGSLTDKYFAAIMRPGLFSTLTLRTAIEQYTNAYLALPGNPPPQLTTSYPTLSENIAAVVGCTVTLSRDINTGALQHDKYWITLKREWEGFIARCREVERSARWPLGIAAGDPVTGEVIFIERERVGTVASEDVALRLHRSLRAGVVVEQQFVVSEIAWTLSVKLGARAMRALEGRVVDLVHQEIAFPFADIIHDQAQRSFFKDDLDEGLESWIMGRLQSVEDIDASTRLVLDLIGGFDREIKREEDEVEMLLPQSVSEYTRAFTAAFTTYTVAARYDFCLGLIALLFFLSEDLPQWDPALLAEVFAVFRGVAMLRYATEQPANDGPTTLHPRTRGVSAEAEEVAARLRVLDVSHGSSSRVPPGPPLLRRLLAQSGGVSGNVPLPSAAHAFLDATGLLQATSPAHASKLEVVWCERLRLMGRFEAAREMLGWLPRTPAVMYVWARLWLDIGRDADAAGALDSIAGSFGPDSALSYEDEEALGAVLPNTRMFDSYFGFYLHAASLFKGAGLTDYEVHFSRLALSVVWPDWDTTDLWNSVIRGSAELAYWDDAYAALMTTPHDELRRECVKHLVLKMCDENAVEKFISFNFVGVADEVEDVLSWKARNSDPRQRPSWSRILYTWYVSRGDYRNAALVMYQRARKLGAYTNDRAQYFHLAEQQLEAYVVAMNALNLLDQKNAWIVLPVLPSANESPRKRRKLTKHIPEDKLAGGKRDSEIVHLSDIEADYSLLSAQLHLVRKDSSLLHAGEYCACEPKLLLSPSSVVLKLAQANRFNFALATARTLDVDMTDLFSHLTRQCLRLTYNPEAVMSEDTTDWLLTDNASSWAGTPADRGWRYLRQSLERHDGPATDSRYSKVVFETIVGLERSSTPPPWLINSLEAHHPEWLIRTCLRYEMFEFALEQTTALIRKTDKRLSQDPPKTAASTWLPYTLIDQILIVTGELPDASPRIVALRRDLHTDISNRTRRMQKLSSQLH
ncbi:hypothetical protein BV25DRAFT_1907210 [Artomyces pyxidatus]|uniref:Uncharacterized protein n=1 Tax=Artomyces pyxidatus TaxID=48021 RepID=A0ACB8T4L5_9AGAM|nr:hypothetical protein BV25DRAFT_1907210 [Artomyces pyxidatus]